MTFGGIFANCRLIKRPMKAERSEKLTPWLYHFFRWFLYLALRIKCRLAISGEEHIPRKGGIIIASNHASYLDPPIVGVASRYRIVRFMARDTLFETRWLGWLLTRFGVVALDRTKGDVGAIKTAIRLLKAGNCVCLFPEGTRSVDGELQEAKGGIGFLIHKAGVPVVPAFIQGTYQAWPKGAKKLVSYPVSIAFGPVISPEDLRIEDERGKPDFAAIGGLVMDNIGALSSKSGN